MLSTCGRSSCYSRPQFALLPVESSATRGRGSMSFLGKSFYEGEKWIRPYHGIALKLPMTYLFLKVTPRGIGLLWE